MRKLTLFAVLLFTSSVPLVADTLITLDGKEYPAYKVTMTQPDRIFITYMLPGGTGRRGVATVPLETLPENLQKQFNFDPARAAQVREQRQERSRIAAERQALEAEQIKRNAQQASAQSRSRQEESPRPDENRFPTSTVTVRDNRNRPIPGAEVFYVHPQKKVFVRELTDEFGRAQLYSAYPGNVVVYCAHPEFRAFRKTNHRPTVPLRIELESQPGVGSIVCQSTGHVPGLIGRLNPILDSQGRTYMYADNISLNNGTQQPVTFSLRRPISAEDRDGNFFHLTVIDIIGRASLIEYRRRR